MPGSRCASLKPRAQALRRAIRVKLPVSVLPVAVLAVAAATIAHSQQQASPQGPPTDTSRDTVLLDAAHGGSDIGTQLTPQLLEKDLTLALSVRLRSALTARGMHVVTTRERDLQLPAETRAAEANHAHPVACLVLHATASGSGVHLYTSSLGQAPAAGGLVPWATAGAQYAIDSLKLASELSTALAAAELPFTLGRVRLQPLDALRCPAVALEIAPLHPINAGSKSTSAAIDDPAYTERVVNAVAAALVQWHGEHAQGVPR